DRFIPVRAQTWHETAFRTAAQVDDPRRRRRQPTAYERPCSRDPSLPGSDLVDPRTRIQREHALPAVARLDALAALRRARAITGSAAGLTVCGDAESPQGLAPTGEALADARGPFTECGDCRRADPAVSA